MQKDKENLKDFLQEKDKEFNKKIEMYDKQIEKIKHEILDKKCDE